MYANCEQVPLEFLGNLSHKISTNCVSSTEFDSDNLKIQLSILVESYHSFRQGEGGDTVHNVIDFLKKNKKGLIPCTRSHVLGQDCSIMSKINSISECAFIAQRRVKSYLHTTILNNHLNNLMTCTVHKELVKEPSLKQVTIDFVDIVERCSSISGHFSTRQ